MAKWQKGQSGNLNGRPKQEITGGILKAKNLLTENAEAIVNKCIELALTGDTQAIKICIERILPAKQEIDIPEGLSVSLNMVLNNEKS